MSKEKFQKFMGGLAAEYNTFLIDRIFTIVDADHDQRVSHLTPSLVNPSSSR